MTCFEMMLAKQKTFTESCANSLGNIPHSALANIMTDFRVIKKSKGKVGFRGHTHPILIHQAGIWKICLLLAMNLY